MKAKTSASERRDRTEIPNREKKKERRGLIESAELGKANSRKKGKKKEGRREKLKRGLKKSKAKMVGDDQFTKTCSHGK